MTKAGANETAGDEVVLSPFIVTGEEDTGYLASTAQSGTRLRTALKDIAGSVTVVTKDFMNDIGAVNLENLLTYTLNTEITGVGGNYSGATNAGGDINFDSPMQTQSVAPVTRVRGLTSADNTADFFVSAVALDSYNIDRVEINRGPNAMLFGLGSPAGIINSALIKAQLNKTKTKVTVRTDQNGSYRGTLDFNDVLIKDQLAVRLATLYSKDYYRIEPAYRENKRGYATLTYRPFKDTYIRASLEQARIDSNNPRSNPPQDAYTWWWAVGKPVYNSSTGTIALTGTPYALPIANSPGTFSALTPTGGRNSNIITTNIGTIGLTNNMTLIFSDPASSNLGIPGSAAVGFRSGQISNVHANSTGTALVADGWMGLANTSTIMNNVVHANDPTKNFWNNYVVTDPKIYDFYHHMMEGPNKYEWARWNKYNVTLEQHFFGDKAGVEIGLNRELLDNGYTMPTYSQGAYTLRIDFNQVLPDGNPNPNFGRPMIGGFAYKNVQMHDKDTARLTAYYNLDLRRVGPSWLGKILGRHSFTGTHTRYSAMDRNYGTEPEFSAGQDYALLNQGSLQDPGTQGRIVSLIHYVGPNASGFATPMGGLATTTGQWPSNLQSVKILWYTSPTSNAVSAQNQWQTLDFQLITNPRESVQNSMRAANVSYKRLEINSTSLVAQSYLLDNALVGTVGWRRDGVYTYDAGVPGKDNITRVAIIDGTWATKYISSISDDSVNYGLVGHSPKFIKRWLPFDSEVSLFYNKSDNFQPTGQRLDMYEHARGPEKGKTSEYGLMLATFHGKLHFKFARYKTENADSSRLFDVGTSISNMADAVGSVLNQNLQGVNSANPEGIQAFNAWLAGPFGQQYQKTFRFVLDPVSNQYSYDKRAGVVVEVADVTSTGQEYEVTYNPTKNWRISFNASRDQAVRTNSAQDLQAFVNSLKSVYDGPAGELNGSAGGSVSRFRDLMTQNVLVPMLKVTTQDGGPATELRRWHWSAITNYSFTDSLLDGKLKGWAVGGGMRWMDKAAIGFPVTVNAIAGPIPDVHHPYYAAAETNYDGWISYGRKLRNNMNWTIQLNIRNLGVGNKLIPVSAQPDGTYNAYRIAEPQTWALSSTLSF